MHRSALFAAAGAAALLAGPAAAQTKDVSELVVTAAPYAVSMDSATTSVDVLKRDDLDLAPASGLGDVLAALPGVRSTFFGPGASRPVIRGLAGPRVMVLTNGVGQIDASALSPDHQVATDPQEAERIEVLRGPASLAYGGSAIGGVVNVIDDRIPEKTVDGIEGRVLGSYTTGNDGKSGSASVKMGLGAWVVSLDAARRESDDYEIPVPAESRRQLALDGEALENLDGTKVENSGVELTSYGGGISYVADKGFFGLSVKRTDTTYGVPGHSHEDGEETGGDEEGNVSIDLKQTRVDARGAWDLNLGPFERVKFSGGYADYEHVELEGGAVGTRFLSDGVEARLELVQKERDGWQGALGFQALHRNFDAIGDEALVPKTDISEVGVFTLQRLDRDSWGVEGGLRLDRRDLDSVAGQRDFTNVSASLGGFIRPAEGWFLGLSASRASRAPTEEELFADGPHPATRTYEVGADDLDQEVSYSLDATVHYQAGPWEADFHAFGVRYDGFIDLRPIGVDDADSGLPINQFVQTDAEFYGTEFDVAYRLWQDGESSFKLNLLGDYVHGDTDLGAPARIPPWSVTGRAVFDTPFWTGTLELRQVGDQDRVAEDELPTDGYRMLNASLVLRPAEGLKVFLEGRNLNDAEAREHASFLKDLAPLPGRSFRIGVGYAF